MHLHDKIFVYGTLKSGHCANSILQGRAEYIGKDRINGTLYDLGAFPGLRSGGTGMVSGEVWEITDPALPSRLDEYEGYPTLYDRRKMRTESGYNVWVYEYYETPKDIEPMEDGEWR